MFFQSFSLKSVSKFIVRMLKGKVQWRNEGVGRNSRFTEDDSNHNSTATIVETHGRTAVSRLRKASFFIRCVVLHLRHVQDALDSSKLCEALSRRTELSLSVTTDVAVLVNFAVAFSFEIVVKQFVTLFGDGAVEV